jgi:hypothetical protein
MDAESEILTTLYIRFALSRISNENDVRPDRTRATRTSDNGDMVSGSIDPRTAALISFLLTWYNAIHCTHVTVYKMIKYTAIWSLWPDVACRLYCSGGSFVNTVFLSPCPAVVLTQMRSYKSNNSP